MSAALFYTVVPLVAFLIVGAVGDLWAHFFDWGGGTK